MIEDLDVFFQDGVTVEFGATETTGILDIEDELVADGLVLSTSYSLTVRTSDFATEPVMGDEITVDGDDYTVNVFRKIDDGKIAKIGLSKV